VYKLKYDLLIKGGHVVDPANRVDEITDIAVKDGLIAAVGPDLDPVDAENTVKADGMLVLPGIVDSHAHVARPKAGGAGYRMLVKAGVTTAVDFEGPMDVIAEEIMTYGCGLNVAVLEGLWPGSGFSSEKATHQQVVAQVQRILDEGSIGVKLLGGHYPLTPETTSSVIEVAAAEGAYVAFHVGSTATGSNILGLEEAVELAAGHPLHIAHVNSYCRGLVDDPLLEIKRALDLLKEAPNVVSESHLASLNGCSGRIGKDGLPQSHVTRNSP
jgi:cytosine/adenosine deaminase-related metal-dependent hydrolase